ncbi:TonB-dependent receptor plug domain-containing protein [Desertivirga brevis]|uniref:TonB-dependent receptor plug domain-containing protein n=1 Tax=Desertivirga brevis TaxID=2810310 RepID=UPI001A97B284|nr:TonB-dependent receptor [Pedobacter sp. SYSU D00873]
MKSKKIVVAAGLGLAQLALSVRASAQRDSLLKEVVVTATKLDQKQSQTGKVISVITAEVLGRSLGKTLPQVLSEQASVLIPGAQGNYGKDKTLFLRGAGTAYTPILIDGLQVNDPSAIGATFDLRLLPVEQIERIEILRGGQSTLYGSDAVAGIINIITKKGGSSPLNATVTASCGSFGTYRGAVALSGASSKLSYNLNYSHLQSDGISEAKEVGGLPFDSDRFIQDGVNASVGYNLNEKFFFRPFFQYQYFDSQYDSGAFSDVDASGIHNVAYTHFLSTGLSSTFKSGSSKVTLNYNFSNTDRVYKSSFPGTYEGNMHLADLFLNQRLSSKVQLLAGVENRFTRVFQSGAEKERPEANLISAYGSLSVNSLADHLDLELGGRANNHSEYGANYTYSVTPSVNFFDNKLRLFGTISTAFKAPTLTELYGAFGANKNLKPQKADNYEAGFSIKPATRFELRVTGYERYLKDAIVFGAAGYENIAIEDTWGAEIEPTFTSRYVDVKGFYAFLKGKSFTRTETGEKVLISEDLLRRPKHSAGVFIGLKPSQKIYTSINFRNYGRRADAYFDDQTFNTISLRQKAYQLLDLYGEYKYSSKFKLFLNVNNVLDEDYQEVAGYSTMGTNFMFGLNYIIK